MLVTVSENEKGIDLGGIVISAGIATAGILAIRWLLQPGNSDLLYMRLALVTKRTAQKQVDFWQIVADKAATEYNYMRNVNA
jgi:hypothetical protein